MTTTSGVPRRTTGGFRHEAVLYRGPDDLVATVAPFVRDGVDRGESVMVAMPAEHLRLVRRALDGDAARVGFVDMQEIGGNPARIIPEWRRFVEQADGRPIRGVGEPVWAARREVEIDECALHEALLNLAFDAGPEWRLLCPYDVDALPPRAVEAALRTHPLVGAADHQGIDYQGHGHAFTAFTEPLTAPPEEVDAFDFDVDDLPGLRDLVRRQGRGARLAADATEDLVLAAHELAANSVYHGGGRGVLSVWTEPGAFVVEVRDSGTIENPLVGRELGSVLSEHGRGVWMANQLCDLVQVRSTRAGAVVRLFAWL